MRKFWRYYFGILLHPTRSYTELLQEERRLRFGVIAILINMFLYTWVYVNLTIGNGAPSSFTPWLAIPKDVYYFYDRYLLAPSMFICWVASAGVVQLASKAFSGKGLFEDTLSALGFAIGLSCLASLLHDLPDSLLGAIGILDLRQYEVVLNSPTIWRTILWICFGSSLVLFVVLFWKAAQVVQRIRSIAAFVVGLLGFVTYQVLFVVFNR